MQNSDCAGKDYRDTSRPLNISYPSALMDDGLGTGPDCSRCACRDVIISRTLKARRAGHAATASTGNPTMLPHAGLFKPDIGIHATMVTNQFSHHCSGFSKARCCLDQAHANYHLPIAGWFSGAYTSRAILVAPRSTLSQQHPDFERLASQTERWNQDIDMGGCRR